MTEKGPPQLRIGGSEVPMEHARRQSQGGRGGGSLSYAQREILAVIREKGSIRAVEAGVIVHAHRSPPCLNTHRAPSATDDRYRGGGKGCCAFASTDGSSALKRLRERGMIEQRRDRSWVPAGAGNQP